MSSTGKAMGKVQFPLDPNQGTVPAAGTSPAAGKCGTPITKPAAGSALTTDSNVAPTTAPVLPTGAWHEDL